MAPRTSLLWLMAAPMLLDLLWPLFLLTGIEHVRIAPGATRFSPFDFYDYPWSHSLAMAIVWGIAFAAIYFAFSRYARGAVALFLGVVSHWVFDFVVHRADLPLWPGGPKVGLGLWNVPPATIAVESAIFAVAILIYRETTEALDGTGSFAFWSLVILLGGAYIWAAGGQAPPNVQQLAYSALALLLIPIWAGWADKHRGVTIE